MVPSANTEITLSLMTNHLLYHEVETNFSCNTPFTFQPRPNNAKALTPKLKLGAFLGHTAVTHDT